MPCAIATMAAADRAPVSTVALRWQAGLCRVWIDGEPRGDATSRAGRAALARTLAHHRADVRVSAQWGVPRDCLDAVLVPLHLDASAVRFAPEPVGIDPR